MERCANDVKAWREQSFRQLVKHAYRQLQIFFEQQLLCNFQFSSDSSTEFISNLLLDFRFSGSESLQYFVFQEAPRIQFKLSVKENPENDQIYSI